MPKVLTRARTLPLLLLAACGGERAPKVALNPADTVAWSAQSVREELGTCRASATDSTKMPCVKVDITWPELAGDSARVGEAKAFIRRLVASSFQNGSDLQTPDSVRAEMLSVHKLMGDQHKGGYSTPWLLERQVTVACNTAATFGIKVVSRQKTVDPHVMSATRFANFDARTGAPTGLADILKANKEQEFRRLAGRTYAARKDEEKALGSVKINPDSFPLPKTVLACGDSLVLQYDAITMGPHRVLDATVTLHGQQLEGLLKD